MRNIYLIITTITTAFFLSACGGGGGSDASFNNVQNKIIIPDCETYEDIQTGDTIIQDENNTSIKTLFNTDGSKKVCLLTGSAYILRD